MTPPAKKSCNEEPLSQVSTYNKSNLELFIEITKTSNNLKTMIELITYSTQQKSLKARDNQKI